MEGADRAGRNEPPGRNREITDALAEHIAVLDGNGRIVAVNAAWRQLTEETGGDPAKTGVGANYFELCRGESGMGLPGEESVLSSLQAVAEGRLKRFCCEYPSSIKGSERYFLVSATPLPPNREILLSHRDISECERAAPILPESGSLFSEILSETTDAVFLCDPSGRLLLANAALAQWFERLPEALTGRGVAEIGAPEMARVVLEQNAAVIAAGQTRTFEMTLVTVQGIRTLLVTKGLHQDGEGNVRGVFGIARDISKLRAMERNIIEISDQEKQRLGHELHENLCQYLVGITLCANALHEELLSLKIDQADDARQINNFAKDALAEVRTLAKGLSLMSLEHAGLASALQELAEQARGMGKIRCSFHVSRTARAIEPTLARHLYRIAQEAVYNAIKHSQGRHLKIKLSSNRRAVVLTVQDDGIGFTQPDDPHSSGKGLGLHSMNYRSRAIGAKLEIHKHPVKGTIVICTVIHPKKGRGAGRSL